MVDELMLRDVNNILKKLELIRSREDLKQILNNKLFLEQFLNEKFEGGRHQKRVDMIHAIEEK